jgi:hypothetical protein
MISPELKIAFQVIPAEQNANQGNQEEPFPEYQPENDKKQVQDKDKGIEKSNEGKDPGRSRAHIHRKIGDEQEQSQPRVDDQ